MIDIIKIIPSLVIIIVFLITPFIIDKKYSKNISYSKIIPAIIPTSMIIIDLFILIYISNIIQFTNIYDTNIYELIKKIIILFIIIFSLSIIRYFILKLSKKNLNYIKISFLWILILILISVFWNMIIFYKDNHIDNKITPIKLEDLK